VPAADLVAGVHGVMPELVVNDRQFESLGGIAVDNRSTPTLEPADCRVKRAALRRSNCCSRLRSTSSLWCPAASSLLRVP
jgi:hypothetical protein